MAVDGAEATVVDVALECDRGKTPWCDCTGAPSTEAGAGKKKRPRDGRENIAPVLTKNRERREA
jgi:hypothetical protein